MIRIDLEGKQPTDTDIPEWTPWTQERWDAWLRRSEDLRAQLVELDKAGRRAERNALIDNNSEHWGELKDWLLALSGKKCWFSEAKERYSHYDVEHFRPKKEAKSIDGSVRDGYWWLAFDYTNFRLCGNVGNRMKGGWFPLKAGSVCSTYDHQCEELEVGYLLDPIKGNDVALLAFDEEGKAVPVPGISQWQQERVNETIRRMKLNDHRLLAEERRKLWQRINRLVNKFYKARARCADGNPVAEERMEQIREQVRELTERSAALSATARWCIQVRGEHQLSRLMD